MPSYRPESHKTLVQLIRKARKAKGLVLETVVKRLPAWMNFDAAKLSRVERGQRDVSYSELREIALAIDSDIRVLVNEVEDILAAKTPRRKR